MFDKIKEYLKTASPKGEKVTALPSTSRKLRYSGAVIPQIQKLILDLMMVKR